MKLLASAVFGLIFGLGLLISGMVDPAKVLGFLDVAGRWNPQLAFVIGGAVLTAWPAFHLARRSGQTVFGEPLSLPKRWPVDRRLVGGAALFGIGWGLVGVCPGPAIVLLGFAGPSAWLFGAALVAGAVATRAAMERGATLGTKGGPAPAARSN